MTAPGTTPDRFDSPDGRTYSAPETTPGQAAAQARQDYDEFSAWWQAKGYPDGISLDFSDARDAFASGMRAARAIAAAAPAGQAAPASHVVSHTPAVVRPALGSVIVLALQDSTPETSAQELASTLAALNQGIAVLTVRGVDALRTWEPEQPQAAPELAAAMEQLAMELRAEARAAAPDDQARAEILHETALRIRKLLEKP